MFNADAHAAATSGLALFKQRAAGGRASSREQVMASVQCALALVSLSGVGDKVGLRAVVRAIRSLKGSDRANAEAAKLVLSVAPFASQAQVTAISQLLLAQA